MLSVMFVQISSHRKIEARYLSFRKFVLNIVKGFNEVTGSMSCFVLLRRCSTSVPNIDATNPK